MAAPAPAVGDYYQSAQGKQHRCRMWLQPPSQGKADDECLGTLEPGTRFGPVEEMELGCDGYLAVKVPHPDADLGDPNSLRVWINVRKWVHGGSWRLVQFAFPSAPPEAKGGQESEEENRKTESDRRRDKRREFWKK